MVMKYTNKSSKDNNRRDASLHQQGFHEKCVRMHLICYYPCYSCWCSFLALPSLQMTMQSTHRVRAHRAL